MALTRGISGNESQLTENSRIEGFEFRQRVVESQDFCWTNKGEIPEDRITRVRMDFIWKHIHRVEEKDNPSSIVLSMPHRTK